MRIPSKVWTYTSTITHLDLHHVLGLQHQRRNRGLRLLLRDSIAVFLDDIIYTS